MPRPEVFDKVVEYRLDNGMLFLLLPRSGTPSVSGRILFRVGNVDNPRGQSGLAHMFEHMAFKGTDRIGTTDFEAEMAVQDSVDLVGSERAQEISKRQRADAERIASLTADLDRLMEKQSAYIVPMEFPQLYDKYTLDFNAFTTEDFTIYYTDLPANDLEVWMLMESERIQHPVFREFYPELEVVKEERRSSVDDNPYRKARELQQSLAFTAHPYRSPTIGYMSDLETLTEEEAEAFYATYYVPNNAIAALVGDFDLAQAEQWIQDYFGDIPAGPPPPEIGTVDPPQQGMRRAIHRQGTDPGLYVSFPGFPPGTREARIAELLASVLSRDETSRLDRRLSSQEKAVRSIWVSANGGFERYPGCFLIGARPLEGFSNEQVEAMIWEELNRVVSEPVPQWKLDEIRASYRKRYYYTLETNHSLAEELVEEQAAGGDWRQSFEKYEEYETITVDEVAEMARTLFTEDKATVVYLEPEDQKAPE